MQLHTQDQRLKLNFIDVTINLVVGIVNKPPQKTRQGRILWLKIGEKGEQ